MSRLIQLDSVTKTFGPKCILNHVSFAINAHDRLALLGPNGAGKTTLAKILLGLEEIDSGSVQRSANANVAYLPQEVGTLGPITIASYLQEAAGGLFSLRSEMEDLEQLMSTPLPSEELENHLLRYGDLQERFQRCNGYSIDQRLKIVLEGLGLRTLAQGRQLSSLSGGEQRRVALAGLLLQAPDLLILDEPTNDLDFSTLEWLESYLSHYSNALVIISHERDFLARVTTGILELDERRHQITLFPGNYEGYLEEKKRREEAHQLAYDHYWEEVQELKRYIKSQTYEIAAPKGPKDRNVMAYDQQGEGATAMRARRIGQAKTKLEELLKSPVERPPRCAWNSFRFSETMVNSQKVVEICSLNKSYAGRMIVSNLSVTIHGGDRIALVGPNGSGKSTLAKLLCGLLLPDSGSVTLAATTRLVYVPQGWETLSLENSVLEEYRQAKGGGDEGELRAELHSFGLFVGDEVFREVGTLSSGMRQRLKIALAVAKKPNMLVLDEPTNHLDLMSVESLEKALESYRGTLLLISHDRRLVERLTSSQWCLKKGELPDCATITIHTRSLK